MAINPYRQLEILNNSYCIVESPSKPCSSLELLKKIKQVVKRDGLDPALLQLTDQLKGSFDKKLAARVQRLENIFGHWLTSILKSIFCMNSKQKQVNVLYDKITKALPVLELLKEALEKNSLQTASWLLKRFPQTLERRDEKGNTLLHEFILSGNEKAAIFLLNQGADPNALGEGEKPPLHRAIEKKLTKGEEQKSLELTQLLITKNAKANLIYPSGNSPLLFAVTIEAVEHARLLINAGADTNHERIIKGNGILVTPLNQALATRNIPMMELLLEHQADPNGKGQEKAGETSPILFQALRLGNFDILKMLLDKGASLEKCNSNGLPPLYAALKYLQKGERSRIVGLLVDKGAQVGQKNGKGKTIAQSKRLKQDQDLLNLLKEKGVSIPANQPTA
jgi:ankyrin repeat protein